MREEELTKLLRGKEPEDLSMEELKRIIPMVKDKIIKRNLINIYKSKEIGCKINELPLVYETDNNKYSDISKFLGNIPTPFDD